MSGKLEGKVAVVTGGNSGIGLATAKRFVAEGAYVFITGRRQEELDAAVKEIGKNITGVQGDVAKLSDLDKLYDAVKAKTGRIDILFANAGIAELAPLGEITEENFDRMFNINVKGLLFTVQKALPLIPSGGSIILNASIVASKGNPASSVYSATKAAVRSFARTWTMDLKERKIRVNAVSPGPIRTPAYDRLAAVRASRQADAGEHSEQGADGSLRRAGRNREGRSLPRLRRQHLRHRHRTFRRRRRRPGID